MKIKRLCSCVTAAALTAAFLAGCSAPANSKPESDNSYIQTDTDIDMDQSEGELISFRPVDCGIQAQEIYEYPFIGLTAKLSQNMLDKIDSRDVFVATSEDYADASTVSYAVMRFSAPTQEQKEQEGMSVDFLAWEDELEKIGAIGVYQKDVTGKLDELTACDSHTKLGESADGAYEYYLSINSQGNAELAEELKKSDVTISEMHKLDMSFGYTAFSTDRLYGISTVGDFTTQDVFGNTYTQDVFKDYDLTLVNVFTTWCSPCVEEIPQLEKLRQAYNEKGVKLGVIAVVLDTKNQNGIDDAAIDQAKILYERSNAQFPFLIADDSNMNGRLTGIESFPESFFVDKNGNIVSDPYLGANSLEGWTEIVDQELDNLKGGN